MASGEQKEVVLGRRGYGEKDVPGAGLGFLPRAGHSEWAQQFKGQRRVVFWKTRKGF